MSDLNVKFKGYIVGNFKGYLGGVSNVGLFLYRPLKPRDPSVQQPENPGLVPVILGGRRGAALIGWPVPPPDPDPIH